MTHNPFILIAGNIGAGKTTLTQRLGNHMGWQTSYESVADNPYLADFYSNMQTWAFHLQIYFLGHRATQHETLAQAPQTTIADRSIYEDFEIFTRASLQLGTITQRDFDTYQQIYRHVVSALPKPDLLVYLDCAVPTLLDRIHGRGREMEKGITAEYLELLAHFYGQWVPKFTLCPVLTINTAQLNFATDDADLEHVVELLNRRLNKGV
jgi:deoxyadenosine/deoxycytidine kinase